jgi:hypothetical protein
LFVLFLMSACTKKTRFFFLSWYQKKLRNTRWKEKESKICHHSPFF